MTRVGAWEYSGKAKQVTFSMRRECANFLCFNYLYAKSTALVLHPIPPNQWEAAQNLILDVGDEPIEYYTPPPSFPVEALVQTTKKITDPPSSSATDEPSMHVLPPALVSELPLATL